MSYQDILLKADKNKNSAENFKKFKNHFTSHFLTGLFEILVINDTLKNIWFGKFDIYVHP